MDRLKEFKIMTREGSYGLHILKGDGHGAVLRYKEGGKNNPQVWI